jgi:predicted nuclease of predicted toxin-antitoxin system
VNILDENITEEERDHLRSWRIGVSHIGHDFGRKGIQDEEIVPFLHQFKRVTFFTRDIDFYERTLRHANYCLVYLAVAPNQVANFVRRFLRHHECNTQAKRMGCVVRVGKSGLTVWQRHAEKEISFTWG